MKGGKDLLDLSFVKTGCTAISLSFSIHKGWCPLLDEREKIDKLNLSQERMDDKQRTDTFLSSLYYRRRRSVVLCTVRKKSKLGLSDDVKAQGFLKEKEKTKVFFDWDGMVTNGRERCLGWYVQGQRNYNDQRERTRTVR